MINLVLTFLCPIVSIVAIILFLMMLWKEK